MDSSQRYTGLGIVNHWITALLVIAMLALGLAAAYAPDDAVEDFILEAHTSLGFFTLLFVLWRVGYRLYKGFPPPAEAPPVEQRTAKIVHRLLLALLTLQVVTGPLYLFTEGEGFSVFGLFTVTLPLESLAVLHEPIEALHVYVGIYILPALLALHIAGGIRHLLRSEPGRAG